jgi:hypothetical protein
MIESMIIASVLAVMAAWAVEFIAHYRAPCLHPNIMTQHSTGQHRCYDCRKVVDAGDVSIKHQR